jgi:hypothetical protein
MRKSSKQPRGVVDRSSTTDVVTQLECAFRNPQAALIGALIGGLVPWFGRTLAHAEIPRAWSNSNHSLALAMIAVVIGCACFSGLSVYKFGKAAFGDKHKALGFVLALEGVLLVSQGTTSAVALCVLILINAVANGSGIALARDATRRRCAANARSATTRALNRVARPTTTERAVRADTAPKIEKANRRYPAPHEYTRPAHGPMCGRTKLEDVLDAEIISETRFLA